MKENKLLFILFFLCTVFLFWFFKNYAILSQEHIYFIDNNFLNSYANNALYVWNPSVNNGIYTFLAPFISMLLLKPLAWLAVLLNYKNLFQFFVFLALLLAIPIYYFSFVKYFKNKTLLFLSSFTYILNPWILERVISGHVFFILSLPLYPIIISLFLDFLKSKKTKKLVLLYIMSFFALILSIQFFLVIFLLLILGFVFFIIKSRIDVDRIIIFKIFIFCLFLLIPISINYLYISNLSNQTDISNSFVQDAAMIANSQSFINIFTLTNDQLFYSGNLYGNLRILYMLPILGLIFLLIKRKKNILPATVLILAVFSISHFSKYIHIPLYRDLTKFLLIYVLLLPYVIYEALDGLIKKKYAYAILVFYLVLGLYPYLYNHNCLSYVKDKEINSSAYEDLHDFKTSEKMLFLPFWPDVKYQYDKSAFLTMTDFLQYNSPYENIYYTYNDFNSINGRLLDINSYEKLKSFTDKFNIRYVLFRKDLLLSLYGLSSENELESLHASLNQKSKLINSNEYYDLFELNSGVSEISGNNIIFQKENPTKNKIYIKNLTSPRELKFLESFYKDWNLYLKSDPSDSWCDPSEYYGDMKIIECKPAQQFFEGEELSYLFKKPIFDDTHKIANDYANGWTIDPEYIKKNFSSQYYKQNPDGSIDVEMVLYFKPQSYFYLGLIVSALTFSGCLVYLAWDYRVKKKKCCTGFWKRIKS